MSLCNASNWVGDIRFLLCECQTDFAPITITDYVDLFLIHDPLAGAQTRKAIWKALIDAKKAGKIRSIGVSN